MPARKRKLRKGSAETSTQLQGSPDDPLEPDQLDAAPDTPDTKSTKLSHATNTPKAQERTPQNVHALILEPPNPIESSFLAKVPVESGHTQAYHDWWQHAQSNTRLFGAHLMGDVQQPSLVSSISLADLAFCSMWGCNRVQEHQSLAPLQLILPVLTDPEIVQHAVAALHCGSIQLSMSNVEVILVLANSIGVECLESACIQYLCSKAHEMQHMRVLLRVARLGNHLGLAKICEAAATSLVQISWQHCMLHLAEVIDMPVYKLSLEKTRELLHHAKRGAFSEIQVLELLEHTRTPEIDIAQILHIASLQPQELHVLTKIMSHADRTPGPLLAKVVQQHVTPLSLRQEIDWNTCSRLSDDIVRTPAWNSGWEHEYKLPKTDLSLLFQGRVRHGELCTSLYLKPGQEHCLRDLVCSFTFFEVHTSAPYLRCYDFNVPGHTAKGEACGSVDYLGSMVARHPTSYHGPYTVGVYWKKL